MGRAWKPNSNVPQELKKAKTPSWAKPPRTPAELSGKMPQSVKNQLGMRKMPKIG